MVNKNDKMAPGFETPVPRGLCVLAQPFQCIPAAILSGQPRDGGKADDPPPLMIFPTLIPLDSHKNTLVEWSSPTDVLLFWHSIILYIRYLFWYFIYIYIWNYLICVRMPKLIWNSPWGSVCGDDLAEDPHPAGGDDWWINGLVKGQFTGKPLS